MLRSISCAVSRLSALRIPVMRLRTYEPPHGIDTRRGEVVPGIFFAGRELQRCKRCLPQKKAAHRRPSCRAELTYFGVVLVAGGLGAMVVPAGFAAPGRGAAPAAAPAGFGCAGTPD